MPAVALFNTIEWSLVNDGTIIIVIIIVYSIDIILPIPTTYQYIIRV